jgi:hypothetical protein
VGAEKTRSQCLDKLDNQKMLDCPSGRAARREAAVPQVHCTLQALFGNLHERKTRWLFAWRKTKKTNLRQTINLETN